MKQILLLLMTVFSLSAWAEDTEKWALKTQANDVVLLEEVSYIMASGSKSFTLVKTDASTIGSITSFSFTKATESSSGIKSIAADAGKAVVEVIGDQIVLLGAAAGQAVGIYNVGGTSYKQTSTQGEQTTIDISGLAKGVYVLKVGDTSVKFLKK